MKLHAASSRLRMVCSRGARDRHGRLPVITRMAMVTAMKLNRKRAHMSCGTAKLSVISFSSVSMATNSASAKSCNSTPTRTVFIAAL